MLFPSFVRARLPPPLPDVFAILSATVMVPTFVVSSARVESAANPPVLEPLAPAKLLSKVVIFPVVNSPPPPTLSASVAPGSILIFEAVQFPVTPL